MENVNIVIDIIILSYAHTDELKEVTINCINSLITSENPSEIRFNILVIESQKELSPYQYQYSKTIYPDQPFGYNRYMNIGISMTSAPYICLCNNDLIFHSHWATEILKPFKQFEDLSSASPACSFHHPKIGIQLNTGIKLGYRIRYEVSGWCLFFRRNMLNLTGKLDENYIFWCADNDYTNTLWILKLNHVLVTSSIVDHLENKTLNSQSLARQHELTESETIYFKKKWEPRTGVGWSIL